MKRLLCLTALFAAGCGPDPTMPMGDTSMSREVAGRFRVERVGVFEDGIAYLGRRGIYLIHDSETGREFIGVSGIGISELGSHRAGKASVGDER